MTADRIVAVTIVLLTTAFAIAVTRTTCAVDAQPKASLSPNRFVRVRTTVRGPARVAAVTMYDSGGNYVTGGEWPADEVTRWHEWRDLDLGPGAYEIILVTDDGCRARDGILVN